MIKKTPLLIFLLTFAFFAQSFAQTDAPTEKQAAIKELVAIISADNKAEDFANQMSAQLQTLQDEGFRMAIAERGDLTAADKKAIEESYFGDRKVAAKRFQDKLMQKLNFNEMMTEITTIVYDKNFTLEEIRDLTAFYRTSTGQKILKMMSPIMTDTMQLISERLLSKIPSVIKELEAEERVEIERKINARKPKPKNKTTK